MAPYIQFRRVCLKVPDGRCVFRDADLELHSGERVVITGATGSGKNTFLKLITGLEQPTEGGIYVLGEGPGDAGLTAMNALRTRLGVVFSHSVLVSNLKAIENVALPLLYHRGMSKEEAMVRAQSLLNYVGYTGDFWSLPGGLPEFHRMLVLLARAMSLEPDIIACENPTDMLRPSEGGHIVELLKKFQSMDRKRLLVVTTSSRRDIELLRPDRLIKIENSRFRDISPSEATA